MPKLNIEAKSKYDSKETYSRVKNFLETDQGLRKLDAQIKCTFDDNKMTANANGSQFKANLQVLSESPTSKVVISVDLPFLLMPFKGKVEETLQRKLEKALS